jgi:flagellar basal-body rod modification protein FlgD
MEINGVAFKDPDSGGGTKAASTSLADTFDTFLALLTTQLQNQDPLDPMESSEFTSQLVQFSGVEQSINTNKKLDQLVQLQVSNQLNSAVAFIGKTVEVISDLLLLDDGAAKISYGLDRNAAQTIISITDQNGRAVRSVQGETAAGRHEFEWDGRGSNGVQVPDGVYGFSVIATDGDDETIDTIAASFGRVTGVEVVENAPRLNIGELGVPFDAVFAVRENEPSN